jgi:peptidoglycan L-alanyl-D-glutamate endopeptidase CwlK
MSFVFSQKSLDNFEGVHERLVAVTKKALELSSQDFSVTCGVRTKEEQARLVEIGKSQTMDSRHLTGHAVDVVPYPITWDWEYFFPIADAFIKAAKLEGVPIRWGGNWRVKDTRKWHGTAKLLNQKYPGGFPDGPHFEIPRSHGYD